MTLNHLTAFYLRTIDELKKKNAEKEDDLSNTKTRLSETEVTLNQMIQQEESFKVTIDFLNIIFKFNSQVVVCR